MTEISKSGLEMMRMIDDMRKMETAVNKINVEKSAEKNVEFKHMLADAIHIVDEYQQDSASLKQSYEVGDPNVSLAKVMIASQKANLSFQALLQVRNKFINAYKEIMNMSV